MARKRDGTKTKRVTLLAAIASTKRGGSLTASSGMITSGTPCSNGPKISQVESAKVSEVFWQQTSPAAKGYSRHIQAKRFTNARCESTTPLGRPVEPEV